MTRYAAIALTAVLAAACQSTAPALQPIALSQDDIDRLRIERDERRITYYEWAERTGAAARANDPLSPAEEEALRHRQVLAWQVDAGTMTPEQFEIEIAAAVERVKAAKAVYEPLGGANFRREGR